MIAFYDFNTIFTVKMNLVSLFSHLIFCINLIFMLLLLYRLAIGCILLIIYFLFMYKSCQLSKNNVTTKYIYHCHFYELVYFITITFLAASILLLSKI